MFPLLIALTVSLTPPERLDTRGNAAYTLTISNGAAAETPHLSVDLYFGSEVEFLTVEPALSCGPTHVTTARCVLGVLPAASTHTYTVTVRPPGPSDVQSSASLFESAGGNTHVVDTRNTTFYRWYTVTNAGDDGAGSFRSAIEAVNGDCIEVRVPCAIEFAIAGTIAPQSRLPRILAQHVLIDGGGSVEIDGSGLEIGSDRVLVRGLTIRNAETVGLLLYPLLRGGYRSMRVERNRLERNLRGVMTYGLSGSIAENTIESNRLSGIYLTTGEFVAITGNTLRDNGAAGIYLHDFSRVVTVDRNVIRANRGYGVAAGARTSAFQVLENSISGNELAGIEHGLDRAPAVRVVPAPLLERAESDVISGRSCSPTAFEICEVLLFASDAVEADGSVEGDVFLGRATAGAGGRFTFRAASDVRGKVITAIALMRFGYIGEFETRQTSEFSDPLLVAP